MVLKDSLFHMWYTGINCDNGCLLRTGYASSEDGIEWKKYPHPVLKPKPGAWYSDRLFVNCVLEENSKFKMWFQGAADSTNVQIGYALSEDGLNWMLNDSPVLRGNSSTSGFTNVSHATVCWINDLNYYMWYQGMGGICLAIGSTQK